MDPEPPRLNDILRDLWDRLQGLLWLATEPIRGTTVAGAWLRLLLLVLGMVTAFSGMQALIGNLPDLFSSLGDFFRNLFELFRVLFQLILPPSEPIPGGAGPGLPGVPSIPGAVRLQILLRRLSQDNLQDFLVFFLIPLIWALGKALNVFEDTFRLNSYRAVTENMLAEYIPLFRRDMAIREGRLVMDVTTIDPRRVGGPMRLEVDADSLAVLEPVRGAPRLITGTNRPVQVDAFERLHRILDLRPSRLEINQVLHTRDGIQITLRGAHFGCRIRRAENGVDRDAAMRLVYRHWLGKYWEIPATREQDTRRLVRRELAQFITDQKDLADLVADAAELPAPALNPVKGQVLREFVAVFNNLPGQSLELTWEEDGSWELPVELSLHTPAPALQTCVQDHILRLELAQMIPGDLRKTEIRRMAQRVLDRAAELAQSGSSRQTRVTELLAIYAELMGNQPGGSVP